MKRTLCNLSLSLAVASLCCLTAAAQAGGYGSTNSSGKSDMSQNGTQLTTSERTFVKKAAEGGLAEVELGKLAAERASSSDVKQFGQRMVVDHTQANDQLKGVASEESITLPEKLDAKDATTKARLEKLSGEQFDHAYMLNMVRDHAKDVTEFRTQAKTATSPAIRNFAAQTLPTLEEHLKQAKSIEPHTLGATHKSKSQSPTGL